MSEQRPEISEYRVEHVDGLWQQIHDLKLELSLSLAREQRLSAALNEVGAAFSQLYLMALNGVVCDPTADPPCRYCKAFWEQGRAVLDRLDPGWGAHGRSFRLGEHPGTDATSAKSASCKSKEGDSSVPDGEGR